MNPPASGSPAPESRASGPLLVVAGEASGDLHAARLLAELRRLRPGLEAFGLGGDELAAAGLERLASAAEISVVGIVEALRVLPRARRIFAGLLAECDRRRPALALLVDFAEFNLRLARALRRRGIPVVYYISPQIWAWRRGRVKAIAERVDEMLVLFPFEREFYRRHGIEATWVGHPLVDEVPMLPTAWDRGGPAPGEPYRLALLPGSRPSEVEALLPAMLETARRLAGRLPLEVLLVRAPSLAPEPIERAVAAAGVAVEVTTDDRFAVVAGCHLALCASGTATLEVGLLRTPLIVLYRLKSWTWLLAKMLVRVPHASLVNLVLERGAVPEMLQSRAEPEAVAAEAEALLGDRERLAAMRRDLGALRERLGEGGASARAAARVAARLGPAPVLASETRSAAPEPAAPEPAPEVVAEERR